MFLVIAHVVVEYFHLLVVDVEYVLLGKLFALLALGLLTGAVASHIGLGAVS